MKYLAPLFSVFIVICLSLAFQLPSDVVVVENAESSFNIPIEEEVKNESKIHTSLELIDVSYQKIFYRTLQIDIQYIPLEVITPPPDKFVV